MRIDHHIHTTYLSPDSAIEPRDLIERAREVGLDGVVITEHDAIWDRPALDDLRAAAGGLLVLSGAEVSANEGHFLVYGLPDLDGIEPGIPLARLLREVERHEAAIIAAHPFRWGQDFDEILATHGPAFHGLEMVSNNVEPNMRERIVRAGRGAGLAFTGSSDAHEVEMVGCYHSVLTRPVRSMREFVAALREGAVRPASHRTSFLRSGPVHDPARA